MVRKITTYTSTCPYCRSILSSGYFFEERWGLKFGRCNHCKKIYRTGKQLYSDLSPEEIADDKQKMRMTAMSAALVMLLSYAICAIAAWSVMVLLIVASFIVIVATGVSYIEKSKHTLQHYEWLKTKDPELYQLEYAESMRIMQKREIHRK